MQKYVLQSLFLIGFYAPLSILILPAGIYAKTNRRYEQNRKRNHDDDKEGF